MLKLTLIEINIILEKNLFYNNKNFRKLANYIVTEILNNKLKSKSTNILINLIKKNNYDWSKINLSKLIKILVHYIIKSVYEFL